MRRNIAYFVAALTLIFLLRTDAGILQSIESKQIPQRCPLNLDIAYPSPSKYGLVPYSMDLSHLEREMSIVTLEAVPPAWDWRNNNGTTPVKNQSSCPLCWGFASTGVLESKVRIQSGILYDLAEENLKECNDWLRGCYGGTIFKALSYFTNHGAVLEASDPYNPDTTGVCNSSAPKIIQVTGWRLVGSSDIQAIKNAVYQYGPCYTTMYASFPGFVDYDGSYVLYYAGSEGTDHAVMIVGWDDNLQHAGGSGAWICKNSWGTSWGDNGFFYIAYGSARIGEMPSYFYQYKYYDYLENLYLYDEGGWIDSYGYPSSNTAWGLVKFTAARDDCIQAVDFWVNVFNLNYTIYIYGGFDGNNLSDLLHSQSGTITAGAGYYSIPLTSPVWVKKGNNFIVVVRFGTTGYWYPVPTDSTSTYHPIETGKCYMSPNGSSGSWTDMGVTYGRDIGIRARTKNHLPVFHGHDFNGDLASDVSVWRPENGFWYIKDIARTGFGTTGDIPVNGDYDGNGTTDIAIFRSSTAMWAIKDQLRVYYGLPGDIPVPGDYDGNGTTDVAIYRPSTGKWAVKDQFAVFLGGQQDAPVPGDYDGDGDTDVAVFNAVTGHWQVWNQFNAYLGTTGDIPVPADYDGDGDTDVAIFRPSTGMWAITGQPRVYFGNAADIPAPGDYDGNGTADIGIFRPSTGMWAVKDLFRVFYGRAGDTPLVR